MERLARSGAAEAQRSATVLAQLVAVAGRGALRTDLEGWYPRRDRSAAAAVDGAFSLLRAPGGLRGPGARLLSRWRPVRLRPSAAPLVLGRGRRDGDPIDLADALARVLSGQGP